MPSSSRPRKFSPSTLVNMKQVNTSTQDLIQELLVMRMGVEAMREQLLANLDAILSRIDQILPYSEPDPRLNNPEKIDWKSITKDW